MPDDDRHPDEGGDPACWLSEVCDGCGAFVGDDLEHVCGDAGTTPADASQHD